MADDNDFREWMKATGHNRREVSKAGSMIGMSPSMASLSSRGERELSETERLAMSARLAGLPPWTPEKTEAIKAVGQLLEAANKLSHA